MLSRTADSLFWMARYMERAENMARLVSMGRRMEGIPSRACGRRDEWRAILAAAGCAHALGELGLDADDPDATRDRAIRFLIFDRSNPSSVASCFDSARANARSARGALTVEMWEAINDAWIEMRGADPARIENGALSPLLDWIRRRGAFFRGATDSSALRNDGFEFLGVGLFVERFDCTARLLDVKFVGPIAAAQEELDDAYAWTSVLEAAGVLRAYHAAYRADYDPRRIANFMIFDRQCPRALDFCARRIVAHLERLAELYDGSADCQNRAAALRDLLSAASVQDIFPHRMHAFLSEAIRRNNAVAECVAEDYHFAPPPARPDADARLNGAARSSSRRASTLAVGSNDAAGPGQRQSQSQTQTQTQTQGPSRLGAGARADAGASPA